MQNARGSKAGLLCRWGNWRVKHLTLHIALRRLNIFKLEKNISTPAL